MEINKKKDGNELMLEISGRLDTSTVRDLEEIVKKELSDVLHLRMEMKKLEYISSVGLRVLLDAKKKMKAAGGTMVISGITETVMVAFKITGFDKILGIE